MADPSSPEDARPNEFSWPIGTFHFWRENKREGQPQEEAEIPSQKIRLLFRSELWWKPKVGSFFFFGGGGKISRLFKALGEA